MAGRQAYSGLPRTGDACQHQFMGSESGLYQCPEPIRQDRGRIQRELQFREYPQFHQARYFRERHEARSRPLQQIHIRQLCLRSIFHSRRQGRHIQLFRRIACRSLAGAEPLPFLRRDRAGGAAVQKEQFRALPFSISLACAPARQRDAAQLHAACAPSMGRPAQFFPGYIGSHFSVLR